MNTAAFGSLVKRWRARRRISQLELALEAGLSARHLSFLETGRSQPSRASVLRLAEAMQVPLRERNDLLLAAGYAPAYRETGLDSAAMGAARRALGFMLERHEPYPAMVMDRGWNVVMANETALATLSSVPLAAQSDGPVNVLELVCAPEGLRPALRNWEEVATHLLHRLSREAAGEAGSGVAQSLLNRLLTYPGVAERLAAPPEAANAPMIPIELEREGRLLRLFSAIATFGTAQDITLAELRIETYFPADEATRSYFEGATAS